jgi:hypothetical protein
VFSLNFGDGAQRHRGDPVLAGGGHVQIRAHDRNARRSTHVGERVVLTGRLAGNFPGGTADLTWRFTLDGDHINRLDIA